MRRIPVIFILITATPTIAIRGTGDASRPRLEQGAGCDVGL